MSNDHTGAAGFRTDLAFYPSVRQGYRPNAQFDETTMTVEDPGTFGIELAVTGHDPAGETDTVTPGVDLNLYGPGDVVGIDESQIIRRDPTPDANDFPPNYFPFVEFDRADFPWLFAPTRADERGRNRPWCCLVAVDKHADGVHLERGETGPLPILTAPTDELPDLTESWAWAHAQVLGGRPASIDTECGQFIGRSNRTLSRLLCPRNLRGSTTYIAAIVPTYDPGRRAGLGDDPYPEAVGPNSDATEGNGDGDAGSSTRTTTPAWTAHMDEVRLPVYYDWEFSTGPEGDFEQLVRALAPRDLGPEVGYRTVDTSNPGPPILRQGTEDEGATVGMGGALKSADVSADADPYGRDPRDANGPIARLREVINQPERVTEALGLPAVGPPKYGQWVADRVRIDPPPETGEPFPWWYHDLNTDPRHRAAAGFGTQIVRDRQENLMARAWDQFGELAEANARARTAQLAVDSLRPTLDVLAAADVTELLRFAGPLLRFEEASRGTTFLGELGGMGVPPGITTPAFRRITRPAGPLARRDGLAFDEDGFIGRLVGVEADVPLGTGTAPAVHGDVGPGVGRLTPGELLGQEAFGDYGRSIDELAETVGPIPDGNGQPHDRWIPSWRIRPDGEVLGVEEAVEFYESNPDVDPDARAVAHAVEGVSNLDDGIRDLQARLTTARRIAAAGTTDPQAIESIETALERLDPVLRAAEERFSAVTGDSRPEAVDPSLTEETVAGIFSDVDRHRERLTDALDEVATEMEPRVFASRLTAADGAASRMLETIDGLREHVDIGPADLEAVDRTAFASVELQAFEYTASSLPVSTTTGEVATDIGEDGADVGALRPPLLTALDPSIDLRMRLAGVLNIDPEALAARPDPFGELLAHPRFYEPMYEPLRDLDQEYLLPGAGRIPKNTVGAVTTNPAFIEAFMAGLNHEMSRELRWRKFPTDRRGTYFRHFWDRRGTPGAGDSDDRADIQAMHRWNGRDLGFNSPRGADDGDSGVGQVVLLIRGELLQRYPNTLIYATKAVESQPTSGSPDRVPYMLGRAETPVPEKFEDRELQKFPDFRGTLEPDITFFGFDLTVAEAVNDPYHTSDAPQPADHNDEGWFFVLEEPPGELHFGLDEADPEDVGAVPVGITHRSNGGRETEQVPTDTDPDEIEMGWSALSWGHLIEDGNPEAITFIGIEDSRPGEDDWAVEAGETYVSGAPGVPSRSWEAKDAAEWGYNSAHMARITLQQPVRVSIHADDLLPDPSAEGSDQPPVTDGGDAGRADHSRHTQ